MSLVLPVLPVQTRAGLHIVDTEIINPTNGESKDDLNAAADFKTRSPATKRNRRTSSTIFDESIKKYIQEKEMNEKKDERYKFKKYSCVTKMFYILTSVFQFCFWLAWNVWLWPGYGIPQVIVYYGLMTTEQQATVETVEVWSMVIIGPLLHLPYIMSASSAHWQRTIWGCMWYGMYIAGNEKCNNRYIPHKEEDKSLVHGCTALRHCDGKLWYCGDYEAWMSSTKEHGMDPGTRKGECSLFKKFLLESQAQVFFGVEIEGHKSEEEVAESAAKEWKFSMKYGFGPTFFAGIVMILLIPSFTATNRMHEHLSLNSNTTFYETYYIVLSTSYVGKMHWLIVFFNFLNFSYIGINFMYVWSATLRMFRWLSNIAAAFPDFHPVRSLASLDHWLFHFRALQHTVKAYSGRASRAMASLVIWDISVTGLLLLRTYQDSTGTISKFMNNTICKYP